MREKELLEHAEMLADACRNFLYSDGETENRPIGRLCHCTCCARAIEALEAWKAAKECTNVLSP